MSKKQLIQELQELLDELFSPSIAKRPDNFKKGGLMK